MGSNPDWFNNGYFFHKHSTSIWSPVFCHFSLLFFLNRNIIQNEADFLQKLLYRALYEQDASLDLKIPENLNPLIFQNLLRLMVPVIFTTFSSKPQAKFQMNNSGNLVRMLLAVKWLLFYSSLYI